MITEEVDIAIVGGGPAGLAAAIAAKKNGAGSVLIIERGENLGGILNQCIHEGFGVERFDEALTGPEYMQRFIDEVDELKIPYLLDSMVLEVTKERKLTVATSAGLRIINAKAVILCMGCRERTRGQLCIPGTRPAGVYTAGTAQNFMNLRGYGIGKKVVILGSGDIGLIMARRLTLEGIQVLAVAEIMPYSSGLPRNMAQCLSDFNIPLYLRHTVAQVQGKKRVEAVTIVEVDDKWRPVKGTEKKIECDTLLLSVGLIPENELSRGAGVDIDETTAGPVVDENMESSVEGIFACGNVLHVHDIVDYVSGEAEKAGESAAEYVKGSLERRDKIKSFAGNGVRYILPHHAGTGRDVVYSLRVTNPGRDKKLVLSDGERVIKTIRKMKVNPAEMIRFTLKREELSGCNELRAEIEDAK